MTLAFAASANISLLLGGKIKMAEMLSGRYADVFSNLFHGYALLWKNHDKIQDERFDCGSKLGFLQANVSYALSRNDLNSGLSNWIKTII